MHKFILVVLALFCVTADARSQAQAAVPAPPPLMLGAAWYPEQWPETRWEPTCS